MERIISRSTPTNEPPRRLATVAITVADRLAIERLTWLILLFVDRL